jgi:hypothetical protein
MDFETRFNRCVEYFDEHEEHVFLLKAALLIALGVWMYAYNTGWIYS